MNKLFLKIATLTAGVAMAIGVGAAIRSGTKALVADASSVLTYTLDGTITGGSSEYATDSSITQDGINWSVTGNTTISPWRIGGKNLDGVSRLVKSNAKISTNDISKVVVQIGTSNLAAVNSFKLYVSSVSAGAKDQGEISKTLTPSTSFTFDRPDGKDWSNCYFTFDFNVTAGSSNSYVQFVTAEFYYEDSSSGLTVSYNPNGGTGEMSDDNSPYEDGEEVTVLENSFTRTNYDFINWNTASDGSGTPYNPGEKFNISGDNVTLYAQWSKYEHDTVNKKITWDLTKTSYASASATQVSWESPIVNMIADKAGAGTATNNYLPPLQTSSRFYSKSTLTFSPLGDYEISSIEITATTENYASTFNSSSKTNATSSLSGTVVTITPTDATDAVVVTLGNTAGSSKVVVNYDVHSPGTKYSVIDEVSNGSLNKSQVTEGTTLNVTIIPDTGYALPESLEHVYMGESTVAYTYVDGVVTVANVSGNITIEAACVRLNPIQYLYTLSNNASSGEFYGYYVGLSIGVGPVLMDGEYGIVLYNSSEDVSSWVEKETIVHITAGTISIYNGLYEVKNYTKEIVAEAEISTPVIHTTTGSETASEASRLTNATGKVTAVTTGDISKAAGTSDIQFTFAVGSNSFSVFYKKAAQTSEGVNALADSLNNDKNITIKGFTSWFNNFQVTMNGIVESAAGYTAEQFAQDLLDQTDAVCDGWKEGDNNHDAIEDIWSDLADVDKYPALPQDQKDILAEADADEKGSVVEQAMARYDYLTVRYNLNPFINGRLGDGLNNKIIEAKDYTNYPVIVVVISCSLLLCASSYIVLKKKRLHK